MDLGIRGRKAIVCASSRGLGRGCADALAQAGCNLVINGRDQKSLSETADRLRDSHEVDVLAVAADVSSPQGQRDLLAACPAPDILINNNGGPPRKDFRNLTRQDMLDGVTQNMVTPLELIQAVIDGMVERRFGRILNITSMSVYMPIEGLDLSSGARAGLTAFLAGVSRTVAGSNVTINNILPGKMDTERLQSIIRSSADRNGSTPEKEAEHQARQVPAQRFGSPEEFGMAAAFLCSVHAGYITGQNLLLDGGLYTSSF